MSKKLNNYHDKLTDLIAEEKTRLEELFNFQILKIYKNKHFNNGATNNYEIDIYILGNDFNQGIIEVKSHIGLRDKFFNKQSKVFRKNHPFAKIYLAYLKKDKTIKFDNICFEYLNFKNNYEIDWI
ncbi:MAG: hypothetical protein ACOC3X_02435 [Nanoarchaeota archaeon]